MATNLYHFLLLRDATHNAVLSAGCELTDLVCCRWCELIYVHQNVLLALPVW